jgi:hypothetical protein
MLQFPNELKAFNSFILWKLEERKGKLTKTPYQINGKMAKVNDKLTWTDFETVKKAKNFSGIGFVFSLDNDILGIDFDHCFDKNGKINKEVLYWIKKFNSYTEISQSGTGIHILLKINKKELQKYIEETFGNETGLKREKGEIYITGRYFALTGNVYNNLNNLTYTNINYLKDFINYLTEEKKPINSNNKQININNINATLTDNEIISLATKFNNNFSYLYNEPGKSGNSEGDQSIINILCFYTRDPGQIKRIMLNSPRTREKFSKHPTYLSNSIKKGLQRVKTSYNPGYKNNKPIKKTVDKPVDKSVDKPIDKPVDSYKYINEYNKLKGRKTFKEDLNFSNNIKLLELDVGSGYYLSKKGFIQRFINKAGDYQDKLITPVQLIPTDLIYLNQREELLLTVTNGINKEVNIFKTDDAFATPRNFKIFLNSHLKTSSWFDGNAGDIVQYDKYISGLVKHMKIERKYASSKLGWVDNEFLPYSKKIILYNNDENNQRIIDSFHQKGDYEEYKHCILFNLKNDIFRAYMNASLSSPVIKPLKLQGFGLYNYAPPNRGKSIAAAAAFSIWGRPGKDTIPSCNVTRAGIEAKLALYNNFGPIFDDSQQLSASKSERAKLIYDMANGSGKTRSNIDIKTGPIHIWELVFILTGERQFLDEKTDGGAHKRLLEIEGIPSVSKDLARVTKKIVYENYGFLGPMFIERIKNHWSKLEDLLNEIEDKLFNNRNLEAHITHVAVLVLCDIIMHNIFGYKESDSIAWGKRILEKLPTAKSIDKMQYGLEIIKETYFSNRSRFSHESKITQLGFIHTDGPCFYRNELLKILRENDIPEKQFLRFIKQENIVILDSKNNFKVIKYGSNSIRPIQFKNEFFTEKTDEYTQMEIDPFGEIKADKT